RWPRDWSSDVCSSDLERLHVRFSRFTCNHPRDVRFLLAEQALKFAQDFHPLARTDLTPLCLNRSRSNYRSVNFLFTRTSEFPQQIGRASCRERVYISV